MKTQIKCHACKGTAIQELPMHLAETLAWIRRLDGPIDTRSIPRPTTIGPSAMNNRLRELERLGLIEQAGRDGKYLLWSATDPTANRPTAPPDPMVAILGLWPEAPPLGSAVKIHCGRRRGRLCAIGAPGDPARKASIIGYRVEYGGCGIKPHRPDRHMLFVQVRMANRHPEISREFWAHISCLEGAPYEVGITNRPKG